MIRTAVDRSRPTRGSLVASTALHALLFLLLLYQVGRQAGLLEKVGELTEIAYIEATYGEDVAAKVKLKQMPLRPQLAEEPGRGISTDSAIKPKSKSPEPPRTEPKPAVMDVAAPQIAPKAQPQMLEANSKLEAKDFQAAVQPILDQRQLRDQQVADAAAKLTPAAGAPSADAFRPASASLQGRSGKIIITDKPVAAPSGGTRGSVADVPANLGGGALRAAQGTAPATVAGLAPAARTSRDSGGSGVVDVGGPSGGGSEKSGRKTILDYGTGSGGGGGALAGRRGKLAEVVDTRTIVQQEQKEESAPQSVAEVPASAQGVSMTITGQIQGRKILSSVTPVYPDEARRRGWEGVVAVHFTVLADGRVKDNMYFEQSSVHRDLNRSAMEALKQFRFAPLRSDQAAVEQWGVITIVFRLH
jgi:TonB family protein